jgi:hypothetical protein
MEVPITVKAMLASAAAIGAVVALLIQLVLKPWIKDVRVVNVLALLMSWALAEGGTWVLRGLTGETAFDAFLLGTAGAGLATLGYEIVVNLVGKLLASGSRSAEAIAAAAKALLARRE